jgi:hypothetical protein
MMQQVNRKLRAETNDTTNQEKEILSLSLSATWRICEEKEGPSLTSSTT